MVDRNNAFSVALILLACAGASDAVAQEDRFSCRQGPLTRSVMIVYEIPGKAVPCQVVYSKPSEDEPDQVLWSASNESGYCEFKAREFRAQLESLGWECGADHDDPTDSEQLGEDSEPPEPPAGLDVSD
jgi:hypothetical protein